jgi:cation:H+ antiporter
LEFLKYLNPEILIPKAWFEPLTSPVLLLVAAIALWVLSKSADWLVDSASHLAQRAGLSKIIIGATIVSLGTTTPECAVSVMGAWSKNPGLALGNAVGSVIADTAFIFGLACVLVRLPADRFVLTRQGWVQFGSAALLAAICYGLFASEGADAFIPRLVGFVFLGLLALYLAVSIHWSRQHGALVAVPDVDFGGEIREADAGPTVESTWQAIGVPLCWIGLSLVIVILASRVTIVSATIVAKKMGVPDVVISSTLVAFGTSLPELIVAISSLRRGHPELLVGNIIGADILNVLFVIGASAVAMPLPIIYPGSMPDIFLRVHLPFMLGVLLYFRVCIFIASRDGYFRKAMGWPLLGAYALYILIQAVVI